MFMALTWRLYGHFSVISDDDLVMITAATVDVMGLILMVEFLGILFEASDSSETEPEDGSDKFPVNC